MSLFLLVASTHFLALLLPGADFFLIVRQSLRHGWRSCLGLCSGIATGNAVFIAMAFAGLHGIQQWPWLLWWLQALGGLYLLLLAWVFLRPSPKHSLNTAATATASTAQAWQGWVVGLLSALLNPKNGLFYISLASVLGQQQASGHLYWLCGVWMVLVVWVWDVLVAVAVGRQQVLHRFELALPWLERGAGVVMALLAGFIAWQLLQTYPVL